MNLSFKVFGYEIWSLEVDAGDKPVTQVVHNTVNVSPVDRFTKAVSRQWVKAMIR